MTDEVKKYEMGKRWLAKMMGADIETFTDSDVEVPILKNVNVGHEIKVLAMLAFLSS